MSLVSASLTLIGVQELEIYKNANEKWKVNFNYNGNFYNDISMTDPNRYKAKTYENAYIVASIPAEKGKFGCYFKFAAAIYPFKAY
jgi:hypothetical protein